MVEDLEMILSFNRIVDSGQQIFNAINFMISTAAFKKQIARPFGAEMRKYGFKGTGLSYCRDHSEFLFLVYIEPGRWGNSCSPGLSIHPKQITKNYNGQLNLSKLKSYDYEFKMSLGDESPEQSWPYSNDEFTNLVSLAEIIAQIKTVAFPVIDKFMEQPNILDNFDIADMSCLHKTWLGKTGVSLHTTEGQFAWAMAMIYEHKDQTRAKQFANWLLAETNDSGWYNEDLKRILAR